MTPDEIKKLSDADLLIIVNLYNKIGEDYDLAVREHCRRQEIKETENKVQMSTSVRWARIAGIAAIVGIIVPFLPIPKCTFHGNDTPYKIEQNNQETTLSIQQPTRSTVSSSFSHTDQKSSINSKNTSTHATPSQKNK